jgi:hypothetical protein
MQAKKDTKAEQGQAEHRPTKRRPRTAQRLSGAKKNAKAEQGQAEHRPTERRPRTAQRLSGAKQTKETHEEKSKVSGNFQAA